MVWQRLRRFCLSGNDSVAALERKMSLAYPYQIFPLRVLKQIAVMFFSACGPEFRLAHPELVKFVLDRQRRLLPKDIHIWAYLRDPVESKATRQAGVTAMMSLGGN